MPEGAPRPPALVSYQLLTHKLMSTIHTEDMQRAREQAAAQLASIEDMVTCLDHARECDNTACGADCPHDEDEAREAITADALDVQVRGEWHTPGALDGAAPYEYKIMLCWGGPAVQIMGTLDNFNQPDSARLQYQDWFTEWMDYPLTKTEEETLLTYAQQFYFDE
jgi:hypothetical protein